MSDVEIHIIAPTGVPIPLLAAIGRAVDAGMPGATIGPCGDGHKDCKVAITGDSKVVPIMPEEPEDDGQDGGCDGSECDPDRCK